MPTPIDILRGGLDMKLRGLNLGATHFGNSECIARTVEALRHRFGDRVGHPPADRICSALQKLRKQGASSLSGREFYFACWGLTQHCDEQTALIEDGKHWAGFMGDLRRRLLTPRAWKGLLDAYFRHVTEATASSNARAENAKWTELRGWLHSDLAHLTRRCRVMWPWMEILDRHSDLLGSSPCSVYAEQALVGDHGQIEILKRGLGIPATSWFWRELVISQVERATHYRDTQFKGCLDTLITQAIGHPAVTSEVLAKLLDRYAKCSDRSPHEGLKQFAIETWGNPHLNRQAQWGHVDPSAKEMVSQWLVLEDLHDFFELLESDRAADKRRLGFWKRYIKQISYSHIVLGRDIWFSQDSDWKEFRQKKKGRISRLDGGTTTNNAFIMRIGSYFFVEFGETGNACYGYSEGNEPFNLGSGVLRYPGELRDRHSNIFRETHMDGRRKWESKFAQRLSNLGISPD